MRCSAGCAGVGEGAAAPSTSLTIFTSPTLVISDHTCTHTRHSSPPTHMHSCIHMRNCARARTHARTTHTHTYTHTPARHAFYDHVHHGIRCCAECACHRSLLSFSTVLAGSCRILAIRSLIFGYCLAPYTTKPAVGMADLR